MEVSPCKETDSFSAREEKPRLLENQKIPHSVHENPSLVRILSQ